VSKGLNVTKPATNEAPYNAEAEQSITTPVQFLPSTMLSWRTPAMAKLGAPRKIVVKKFGIWGFPDSPAKSA